MPRDIATGFSGIVMPANQGEAIIASFDGIGSRREHGLARAP